MADLSRVAAHIAKSDGSISLAESAAYGEVYRIFMPEQMEAFSAENYRDMLEDLVGALSPVSEDEPAYIVTYLEAFDGAYGTDHAAKARALILRFATCIAEADGPIPPSKERALAPSRTQFRIW